MIAGALALAASLLVTQAITGVPSMPAGRSDVDDIIALLRLASIPENAVIYELGSGWGGVAIAIARAFPDAKIRGIELSPLPFFISWLRARRYPNLSVTRGSFFRANIQDAGAIVCYLMMKPMPKVAALLDASLKPGTPVVSLAFWFRGRASVGARGAAALYRWR